MLANFSLRGGMSESLNIYILEAPKTYLRNFSAWIRGICEIVLKHSFIHNLKTYVKFTH